MITEAQIKFIDSYVNEKYFDRSKLIKYLSMHEIVGNEIFAYIDKKDCKHKNRIEGYSRWLDNEDGYVPLSVDIFVRRIPFYFYVWDGEINTGAGDIDYILYASYKEIKTNPDMLEEIYQNLEYLFYERNISLYDIFNYMIEQTGVVTYEYFPNWIHYLHLCEKLGWEELMPERFITVYNEALEAVGLEPIIYEINEIGPGDLFYRNGMTIEFEGTFPCDKEGNPIMKWIGVKITNGSAVRCSCKKSQDGYLRITLTPSIIVYALNCYNDANCERDEWYQIFAGPQNMEFDYRILKYQRNLLNLTQQQVADAVEANVRTYQKWENGETKPDGFYLLRLLNWLDIPDVQSAIQYKK